MATPSLEDALNKIAADNDLTNVAVGRMPVGARVLWTAIVHWDGHAVSGIPCAQAHSDISIHDALTAALAEARKDRTPNANFAPPLPSFAQVEAA